MKKQIWFVLVALVLLAGRADAVTFNSRGQVAQGIGGGAAAIDNQAIACCGGGATWTTDDTVVYQVCDTSCRLETYDTRSGAKAVVADRGANAAYGGGGVWVAWLGGYGTYTSTGQFFASSTPGAVGPDGAIALKVEYNSYGPWDVLERNGSRWRLTEGDAYGVQLLGNGRAVWYEGGALHTRGLPAPQSLPGVTWWARTAFVNGSPWIMYQSANAGGKLVVHPYASLEGYVITQGNDTFGPDFVQLGNKLRIAYGAREGEQPGEVVVLDVDLSAPRTNLSALIVTAPTVPPPVIVTPPAPPVQTTQAPDRRSVVVDVMRAHPEINTCDEDKRGAIVDLAAQQLNGGAKQPWGRKSRGKPNGDVAVNPNTDGLTFLRGDGRFEIIDVISGAGACGATWDNAGVFDQGGNGWWAPPQGVSVAQPPTPAPPSGDFVTKAQMEQAIRHMHEDLWNEVQNTVGQQAQAAIDRAQQALEHVEALEQKSADDAHIRAIVADIIAHAVISGKTRVAYGHQHLVDLGLTIRP